MARSITMQKVSLSVRGCAYVLVLTKVIVYGGIGYIATNAIPILFVSVERYLGIFS